MEPGWIEIEIEIQVREVVLVELGARNEVGCLPNPDLKGRKNYVNLCSPCRTLEAGPGTNLERGKVPLNGVWVHNCIRRYFPHHLR